MIVKPGNIYMFNIFGETRPVVVVSKVDIGLPEDEQPRWNVAYLEDMYPVDEETPGTYPQNDNIPTEFGVYFWADQDELKPIRLKKIKPGQIYMVDMCGEYEPVVVVSRVGIVSEERWNVAALWQMYPNTQRNTPGLYPQDDNIPTKLGAYWWAAPKDLTKIKRRA
jgi:hypothetical protein